MRSIKATDPLTRMVIFDYIFGYRGNVYKMPEVYPAPSRAHMARTLIRPSVTQSECIYGRGRKGLIKERSRMFVLTTDYQIEQD